jgi:heme-degrading monooxygenase HmoA
MNARSTEICQRIVSTRVVEVPCDLGHQTRKVQMIVMLSARRLKPGAWDQFRQAWEPGEDKPPGFQRAYHLRNIRDEDEIISFGLFEMSEDEYRTWRGEADAEENKRVDNISNFVESESVAGVYEVIEVVET